MHTQETETQKHVTSEQGREFAKLAREFGVNRKEFKTLLDSKEKREKIFAEMKSSDGADWIIKLQESAKKISAKIHVIHNLRVDYSRSHNKAAILGGPQTPSNYNVLKVGDLYQTENRVIMETIILFNFPSGGSYDKAVEWGMSNGFKKTTPHVSFATGEQYPKLNYELGQNPVYVVETTGCSFDGDQQACSVWWCDAKRRSRLGRQSGFSSGYGWFLFLK